ncbi:MAG TPA: hypothetical protein VN711_00375 [Candidatus Saccharimonadales bacterium]|nr:hypothetical protein [Candidatus Saccharimonadales bacterium]
MPLPYVLKPEELPKVLPSIHLRYSQDSASGFTREKNGKSFIYLDSNRRRITDKRILERLEALAIPPAWKNVWISPLENGHLQATGTDEKNRKQYIYHPTWISLTQQNKFNKTILFATLLPELRKIVDKDLSLPNLSERKVLATIVWLLGNTYIRIGNDEYTKENNHYGLTTFQTQHVSVKNEEVTFHYVGKSGKEHTVNVSNPRVARTIRKLEELPGLELFQYIDNQGQQISIDSGEVNEYLHEITQRDITAKDFRTWGGTLLASETLYQLGIPGDQKNMKKNISSAIKYVAKHLHNTPHVSRMYYIHPLVFDTYKKDILVPYFQERYQNTKSGNYMSKSEKVTSSLLKEYSHA